MNQKPSVVQIIKSVPQVLTSDTIQIDKRSLRNCVISKFHRWRQLLSPAGE